MVKLSDLVKEDKNNLSVSKDSPSVTNFGKDSSNSDCGITPRDRVPGIYIEILLI